MCRQAGCLAPASARTTRRVLTPRRHSALSGNDPALPTSRDTRKILVAGLNHTFFEPETALRTFFEAAGLKVENVESFRDGRNYAFVTLETQEETIAALSLPPTSGIFREARPAEERAPRPKRRTLESYALFGTGPSPGPGPGKVAVVMDGLRDPANLGSIYRLLATFGVGALTHVHADGSPAPVWDDEHRWPKVRAVARGCERHVDRTFQERASLVEWLELGDTERPPVVCIETASGAESLHDFSFPERCVVLVGAEGRGLDPKVARALRPGFDAFVVIPMCGPHVSLNVASALGISLYEYRRQWPGKLAS